MSEPLEARPTQVRLKPSQRVELKSIARREDRDLSWVIRKALDEYIARYKKK